MSRAAMKMALDEMLRVTEAGIFEGELDEAITALRAALDQPTPVQVSPVDFVELVIEREHMVGKPLYWTQWPNEEKT